MKALRKKDNAECQRHLKECLDILEAWGIQVPPIKLYQGEGLMCYTHCDGSVYITQTALGLHYLGLKDLGRLIMHEIVHTLLVVYPPTKTHLKPFGGEPDTLQDEPQDLLQCLLGDRDACVTRYGMSGVLEDVVETVTAYLYGEGFTEGAQVKAKVLAVTKWLAYAKRCGRRTLKERR